MSGGIQASLAGRYATALFALARDARTIDKVESSLAAISAALSESPDFKALTTSPLVSRPAAGKAVPAAAKALDPRPGERRLGKAWGRKGEYVRSPDT